MKIAEVITARSAWLFDTFELNPKGISAAVLYKALIDRYRFAIFPHRPEDFASTTGHDFNEGTFSLSGKGDLAVRLQIFNDGLVADTRSSTTETDAFLEDLLQSCKTQFGLNYHPKLIRQKDYYSDLTVFPSFDLTAIWDKMASFSKALTAFAPAHISDPQHLTAISFKPNHAAIVAFTFERRESAPFPENKYFSHAALRTERHIELLSEFEKILTS